jgi:hypothetical protein
MGCPNGGQYEFSTIPKIEECRFLTKSIFCTDKRMNDRKVDQITQYIQSQNALSPAQKEELILYFNTNREQIVKVKEFEISLSNAGFFRGYFLTNPKDETDLKNYIDGKLLTLDRYIDRYGRL